MIPAHNFQDILSLKLAFSGITKCTDLSLFPQLNEVFNELFDKARNFKILQEIVEEYDCHYCITFKRGKLISTIMYPVSTLSILPA